MSYLCICSSSSLILSVFCKFLGLGFLTTTVGGVTSSLLNQLESSDLDEKSFKSSSWITRAVFKSVTHSLEAIIITHLPGVCSGPLNENQKACFQVHVSHTK